MGQTTMELAEKRMQEPEYLAPKELAAMMRVTNGTVGNWIKRGLIPEEAVVRYGRTVRINRLVLEAQKKALHRELKIVDQRIDAEVRSIRTLAKQIGRLSASLGL